MRFAHPSLLLVAVAAAALLVALVVHQALARRRATERLASARLLTALTASVSPARRRAKEVMLVAGIVLVAASLARPQLGSTWQDAHRRGVDLLFAIDTSKSMLTPDVKPSRLERAKLAVRDLVDRFPDDRVGLIAFAGQAFVETPLTLDHTILEQSLDALDTSVIPLGGTDVASAIDAATKALADDAHAKVLVLLTDGEDLGGEALAAAQRAAKEGVVVDTVGVGTPRGALIPLATTRGGETQFVKDADGKLVTSHLDETLLRQIATTTGGSDRSLGDDGQGLASLYRDELAKLPRSDLAARGERVPLERYQWPLGLGLLLLAIEPLIGERRRARGGRATTTAAPRWRGLRRHATASAAALASVLLVSRAAWASPQSAERAYRAGKFDEAAAQYGDAAKRAPEDARLDYDLGAASFRKGDFDAAAGAFTRALRTDDLQLQQRAYYDRGDARYRTGERALGAKNTDDAIGAWKDALADYEAALRLEANDADARFNADFVRRRLAELEKKQKDEQDQQRKQQDQNNGQQGQGGQSGEHDQQGEPNQTGQANPQGQPREQGHGGEPKGARGQAKRSAPSGPRPSTGKNGAEPDPMQGSGEPPSTPAPGGAGSPAGTSPQHVSDAPSQPGELSKSEAAALLDSLRGELELRARAPKKPATPTDDHPGKDW